MISTNFDEIKEIIQIPSSLRNKPQLKLVSKYMSNLSFFKIHIAPTGEDIVRKSCEYLQYEFFTRDSYICKIGDPGDKFYVIIQGQVKVLIKPSEEADLVEAATLGQGSSFGEYALLYNHPRIASILCTLDTHLAVLSKQSFLQILGSIENKRIEEIIFFLKNFPVFKNWSKSALVKISYFFTELQLSRKTTVFREGEIIQKVYFVKAGELELLKSMREDLKNKPSKKIQKKKRPSFLIISW
jgi:CRP-like cAMP-binding protein